MNFGTSMGCGAWFSIRTSPSSPKTKGAERLIAAQTDFHGLTEFERDIIDEAASHLDDDIPRLKALVWMLESGKELLASRFQMISMGPTLKDLQASDRTQRSRSLGD
jgi:hypothetical protein